MTINVSDSLVAGAVSGVFTRFLGSPLDVLKVRMQLQIEPTSKMQAKQNTLGHVPKYRGLFQAAGTIFREEGIRAFWKGFLAGQALYIVFGATQFTSYELSNEAITKSWRDISSSGQTAVNFVSGCVAGSTATVASFPFDVLRTRMLSQGEPKLYPSLCRGVAMMYSESGIRTFYKGLTPALLSVTPQVGLQFSIFTLLCSAWESWLARTKGVESRREELKWGLCGGVAGISSKMVMLPLDIVKKRLEVQGFEEARASFGRVVKYKGVGHCLLSIYRQEGFLAFYKGASPSFLKATLGVSLSFTIYKKILKELKKLRAS